jgi:hypothetical protein
MKRQEIAVEMMTGCPSEAMDDHRAIHDAILSGVPWYDVLDLAAYWPDTYVWLKNNQPDPDGGEA